MPRLLFLRLRLCRSDFLFHYSFLPLPFFISFLKSFLSFIALFTSLFCFFLKFRMKTIFGVSCKISVIPLVLQFSKYMQFPFTFLYTMTIFPYPHLPIMKSSGWTWVFCIFISLVCSNSQVGCPLTEQMTFTGYVTKTLVLPKYSTSSCIFPRLPCT